MILRHYKNLDGVRGVAAMMIIVFHFFALTDYNSNTYHLMEKITPFGKSGVTLFFVLSGFLISRILFNTKTDNNYFSNFYLRRSLRIFPLYYFSLILYYIFYPIIFNNPVASLKDIVVFATYFQTFPITFNWPIEGPGHFWSLSVEEHFYLIWPVLIYFLREKSIKTSIFILLIGSFIFRIILSNQGYDPYYFSFTNFDSLSLGALTALLERNKKFTSSTFLKPISYFLLTTIGITAMVYIIFNGKEIHMITSLKLTLISVIYFLGISLLILLKPQNLINKVLEAKPLTFFGKISYGTYVYHIFIIQIVRDMIPTSIWFLDLIIVILLSTLMAFLSYNLFEIRFLKLKNNFTYSESSLKEAKIRVS